MFSHVMLGVNDLEASKKFYDALLGTLGITAPVWRTSSGIFIAAPPAHSPFRYPSMAGQPHTAMAAPSGLPCSRLSRLMYSTPPVSPTAESPAKTRRGFARDPPASCTWPTCATPTATSSARCIGRRNKLTRGQTDRCCDRTPVSGFRARCNRPAQYLVSAPAAEAQARGALASAVRRCSPAMPSKASYQRHAARLPRVLATHSEATNLPFIAAACASRRGTAQFTEERASSMARR